MRRRPLQGRRGHAPAARRAAPPVESPAARGAAGNGRRLLALCGALLLRTGSATREYATGAWSRSFYRPSQVQIMAVGLVNEGAAYMATRSGVKALHEGVLTPLVEAVGEEVTAFHLCHHRSSIFYEGLSHDGGALSIYEYSLVAKSKVKVATFQDAPPATALACADDWLLRASPSSLSAVHLPGGDVSVLRAFEASEVREAISSLSVGFAADVVDRAQVLAVSPANRTILRLHLEAAREAEQWHLREAPGSGEELLRAGDGADGPLSVASALDPRHLLWAQDKVLFIDGCSLRQLVGEGDAAHVSTLLGSPAECADSPHNETLEPAPWATRLAGPLGLAGSAAGTREDAFLLLTEAEVVHVWEGRNDCAGHGDEGSCRAGSGCGWAAGPGDGERLCLQCRELEDWARGQRHAMEACSLELELRAGTRYSLTGCGCVAPEPPAPSDEGDDDAAGLQAFLSVVLVLGALFGGALLYRRQRRNAQLRELYGVDTSSFHVFADTDCEYLS